MKKFFQKLMVALLFFTVSNVFAQGKVTVRLASLVPENTPWGQAINRLAADWSRITNGEVEMIVFHGGVAGDEAEVLRKLRINQVQAAVFTSMGLNAITPEVMAVSYPFLIRNDAELDEVMRKLKPELDAKIQQSGYVTLAWARAGWVRFFTRTPVLVPEDLRKIKLGSGADDPQMLQAFRAMGYQVVAVNLSEVLVAFNSGRVDAVYNSPVYVAGNQIFGIAKNMSSINVAPFMGGVIMNNTAWRRIPDKYKPQLLDACKRVEKEIEASIASLETEAISTMRRYGLQIHELTPAQMQSWYDDTGRYESRLVSGANPVFNREYYSKIVNILAEYRKGR